jgi:hypothetical protein
MVDTFELAVIALLAILSAVGGIPHLIQWVKQRPHLKIINPSIAKQTSDNFRYSLHLEVENERKWWRKSGDASNIVGEYYLIDKNGFLWGAVSNQLMSSYLPAGTRITKDIEGYHTLSPEGNPHSIIFRVTCNESVIAKQRISYEEPS